MTKISSAPTRSVTELTAADIMSAPAVACREEAYFEEVADYWPLERYQGSPSSTLRAESWGSCRSGISLTP